MSSKPSSIASVGLLALRLALGAGMICHGWDVFFGEEGARMQGFVTHVVTPLKESLSLPLEPALLGQLAKGTEIVGGGLLVLGLLTRFAALALAANMGVAVYWHAALQGDPFYRAPGQDGGSWELAALYLGGCLAILCLGAGRASLDEILLGGRPAPPPESDENKS